VVAAFDGDNTDELLVDKKFPVFEAGDGRVAVSVLNDEAAGMQIVVHAAINAVINSAVRPAEKERFTGIRKSRFLLVILASALEPTASSIL